MAAADAIGEATQPRGDAIHVRDVQKRFGATHALNGVSLSIAQASIHSLVGENGAGKSTLLGVLAGRVAAGAGTVEFFGQRARTGDPRFARSIGVAAIYQELTIVPALDAVANVFLGSPLAHGGWQAKRAMHRRFDELTADLGVSIQPTVPAGRLSVADQQLIEIMRAIQSNARIMLFDEPTASLSAPEREMLHSLIRRIQGRGVTTIFVSHNLDEVLLLSDKITVFQDGSVRETRKADKWTKAELVQSMLGGGDNLVAQAMMVSTDTKRADHVTTAGAEAVDASTSVVLKARHLNVPGVLRDIELSVAQGEIVGVAGLVGSGRTSLLRALAGLTPAASGDLNVGGHWYRLPKSVHEARRRGLAIVPEDRKTQGIVPALSAARNITLSNLRGVSRLGWVLRRRLLAAAANAAEPFAFDSGRLNEPVANLSGGNQQKALLARWAYARPRVLLADEPTRGIDIGAKQQIMHALHAYARAGTAVVIVSSELEELVAYCDRILVLARGRVSAEFRPRQERITENDILNAAFGLEGKPDV